MRGLPQGRGRWPQPTLAPHLVNRARTGQKPGVANRYLVESLPPPGPFALPGDVAHHVGTVLRARAGDRLILSDGRGLECEALVVAVQGRAVLVEAGPGRTNPREPSRRVEVAFALPKGARTEWLFEHGTEVGIAAFRPVRSARSGEAGAGRGERWQRIVAAALGQCGRARLPTVHPAVDLAALLRDPGLPGERILADPSGPPLGPAQSAHALLLVGPEGGFTPSEQAEARAHGFVPRGLGRLVLRTETAVLVGAALLLQEPAHGMACSDSSANEK